MAGDKYAALRAEFVAGMMSVADLARAHDTPEKPLQLAATRQGWQALRAERIKNEETARRNAEIAAITDAAENAAHERMRAREDANRRHRELAGAINGEIVRAIRAAREAGEPQDAAKIRALAGALESAQRVERLALGMNTETLAAQVQTVDIDALEAMLAQRADD